MKINFTLARHATTVIEIAGKKILIDPFLADKKTLPPVPLTKNKLRNPRVGLPLTTDHLLHDIDYLLLTHLHFDHFDQKAIHTIPKSMPVLASRLDRNRILKSGFTEIYPIKKEIEIVGLKIKRYAAKHGKGLLNFMMGKGSSYLMDYNGFRIFITGDNLLTPSLKATLKETRPDVVIANGGAARFKFGKPITLSIRDIQDISIILKDSKIIVVHLDALNHCTESRDFCREQVKDYPNILIPDDGQTLALNSKY